MVRSPALSWNLALDGLVVAAAVGSVVGALIRQPEATGVALWSESLTLGLAVLLLLGRRRFPFAAPAVMWVVCASLSFANGALIANSPVVFAAGMGAALLLGNLRSDRLARAGLGLVVVGAAIVVEHQPGHDLATLVFTPLLFVIAWLSGHALRLRSTQTQAAEERAARAERERETATRLAVAQERARIARELHDVVAHALSVMVLQVGVVRRRTPAEQAESREALGNVERAGRAALTEMRRLLDAMRSEDDALELGPQPGLSDLTDLVDEVRSTGLDVRLTVRGEPAALPAVLDLSAYRIVQEGLTNALKHAHAQRVDVDVRIEPEDLSIEVRDDGRGSATNGVDPGYGLVGIRERVSLLGGEMSAGPHPGGYLLQARLPCETTS